MRVLLDTHVFLWWIEGDRALPAKARAAVANRDNECLFSLVSVWELAIKSGWGKLKLAVRLLIAQALEENLPVVTADPIFRDCGVKRIW